MVDDKYIGLALAIAGSSAIGMSFIITKKVGVLASVEIVLMGSRSLYFSWQGLNDAAVRNATYGVQSASDNLSYLRNPLWWTGITIRAFFSHFFLFI